MGVLLSRLWPKATQAQSCGKVLGDSTDYAPGLFHQSSKRAPLYPLIPAHDWLKATPAAPAPALRPGEGVSGACRQTQPGGPEW